MSSNISSSSKSYISYLPSFICSAIEGAGAACKKSPLSNFFCSKTNEDNGPSLMISLEDTSGKNLPLLKKINEGVSKNIVPFFNYVLAENCTNISGLLKTFSFNFSDVKAIATFAGRDATDAPRDEFLFIELMKNITGTNPTPIPTEYSSSSTAHIWAPLLVTGFLIVGVGSFCCYRNKSCCFKKLDSEHLPINPTREEILLNDFKLECLEGD